MACSKLACAQCCTIFSIAGVIFLLIIGILIEKQPLYLKGITDPTSSAQGCFQGAAIYAATLFISVTYWIYDESVKEIARRNGDSSGRQTIKFGSKYGAVASI